MHHTDAYKLGFIKKAQERGIPPKLAEGLLSHLLASIKQTGSNLVHPLHRLHHPIDTDPLAALWNGQVDKPFPPPQMYDENMFYV